MVIKVQRSPLWYPSHASSDLSRSAPRRKLTCSSPEVTDDDEEDEDVAFAESALVDVVVEEVGSVLPSSEPADGQKDELEKSTRSRGAKM